MLFGFGFGVCILVGAGLGWFLLLFLGGGLLVRWFGYLRVC